MKLESSPNTAALPAAAGPSLGELLGARASSLRRVGASGDPARRPAAVEHAEPGRTPPDDALLLAPGAAQLGQEQLEQLIAGAAGAVAIVLRDDAALLTRAQPAAAAAGVALLALAPALSWREADALLSVGLGEHGPGLASPGRPDEYLYTLSDRLAHAFGGSVAVEDHRRNVLAHSSLPGQLIDPQRTAGILFRKVPDSPENDADYRTVLEADDLVRFPKPADAEARTAIAIRAGSIPLGSIWIVDPAGTDLARPLPAGSEELLRAAAREAAAHLLDSWRRSNSAQQPREAALVRLLSSLDSGTELREMGFAEEQSFVLVCAGSDDPAPGALETAEARTAVHRHFSAVAPTAITTAVGGELFTLVPQGQNADTRASAEPLPAALRRALPSVWRLAITEPFATPVAFRNSRAQAAQLLACCRSSGASLGTVAELRAQLHLAECAAALADTPQLWHPVLAAHRAEPAPKEAAMLRTLLTWFESSGRVAETALRLDAHENTVRYRLKKAEQQFDLSLDHPDERLSLWLQLRALFAAGPGGPAAP